MVNQLCYMSTTKEDNSKFYAPMTILQEMVATSHCPSFSPRLSCRTGRSGRRGSICPNGRTKYHQPTQSDSSSTSWITRDHSDFTPATPHSCGCWRLRPARIHRRGTVRVGFACWSKFLRWEPSRRSMKWSRPASCRSSACLPIAGLKARLTWRVSRFRPTTRRQAPPRRGLSFDRRDLAMIDHVASRMASSHSTIRVAWVEPRRRPTVGLQWSFVRARPAFSIEK